MSHRNIKCPAFGKTCNNCKKLNHFAIDCKMKRIKSIVTKNTEDDDDGEVSMHSFKILKVNNIKKFRFRLRKRRGWTELVRLNDTIVTIKFDTGSEVNIISLRLLKKIDRNAIVQRTDDVLQAYNGQSIIQAGDCFLVCMHGNEAALEKFVMINEDFS